MKNKWKIILGILTVLICMLIGCEGKVENDRLLLTFSEEQSEDITEENGKSEPLISVLETEQGTERETAAEGVQDAEASQRKEMLVIHICGAVAEPGVYHLESGSRIYQAVEAAGGFLEEAGKEYLNLADVISDGQKIYIPTVQEAEEENRSKEEMNLTGSVDEQKVNINTASAELLCTLPGVGSSKAEKIIAYREAYGAFQTTEDIMNVEGIKDGVFRKIKDMIRV